ncbi:DUF2971 domain-containing protein [Aeromonas veronii]|uniref:DUF2971 domain-containing protein n=1 Tax=Aeromonas veronii TaxID=654 RepID=UPI0038DDC900
MTIFYKYMSNFGPDFFKKPTIKISNPCSLNDPFESEAGDNLIAFIHEILKNNNENDKFEEIKNMVNIYLKANGIFSVSETPRNLLMWAHYANEHAGLCIGYSEDLFSEMEKPNGLTYKVAQYKPQKVKYDNYRFDKQTEMVNTNNLHHAIKTHLLTKSDDWMYEKEHRCIIPFATATTFKVDKKKGGTTSWLDPDISIDEYILHGLINKYFIKVGEDEYKYDKEYFTEDRSLNLCSFSCINFLYEVNPKYIHSIYMGLRVSNQDVYEFYKLIKNKKYNLEHVKLYKYSLSTDRFELKSNEVDDQYILNIKEADTILDF